MMCRNPPDGAAVFTVVSLATAAARPAGGWALSYGDEVSHQDGGHDPQECPDFHRHQQSLHGCPLVRLGSSPVRLPDPLSIVASGPGDVVSPANRVFLRPPR